ncbi:lanthionine synthetase C family protein [Nocardiopsis sp. CNT-189]|uniref:lanthionine synthetase C family protein n=1 Tax=Nocardiopsis oceanisediminis TaxID=2816862 RepID=UPI003B3755C7
MTPPLPDPRWAFSLGRGAPGILLAHAARAREHGKPWEAAHTWAKAMVAAPVPATGHSGLFDGAPAVAYALHTAAHPAYAPALEVVDHATLLLVEQRLGAAHARIDRGEPPELREFDLIGGLTGLGAYLLAAHPTGALLQDVLAYLVRLTRPLSAPHGDAPGWWTPHSPANLPDPAFPGGHTNLGLAHGAAGPLALLATAALARIEVPGGREAMRRILVFYDAHRNTAPAVWWPEWVAGNRPQQHPGRPSWCYGAPGIAWSHHLAARALGDRARQFDAEHALLGAAAQSDRLAQPGLCHGQAGLRLVLTRAAEHALHPHLRSLPPPPPSPSAASGPGLLDGQAGLDLTRAADTTWANCLLLGRTPVHSQPNTADS